MYVYDEDKPSVQPQPHGALLAQQRAGRMCMDPGLRFGVPGESTDHAQVTSRVVAELAEMGLIDGPDAVRSVTFAPEATRSSVSTGPPRSGPAPGAPGRAYAEHKYLNAQRLHEWRKCVRLATKSG